MKLLATDYDGTLYTDKTNLMLNMEAINKFMSNGNKFAIITGRCFTSIKKEIKNYNIKYDYLACNNGLIVFDNKDNIVASSVLASKDLQKIYRKLNTNPEIRKIKFFNFYEDTSELNNILEMYVKFKDSTCARKYKRFFESNMPNIKCYNISNKLFIGNKKTKADAVSIIQQIHNIDNGNIYTVGDNLNDLEMLEKYNGHKMIYSYPSLWFKKIPVTREVHTLVKKINKKHW